MFVSQCHAFTCIAYYFKTAPIVTYVTHLNLLFPLALSTKLVTAPYDYNSDTPQQC